MHNAGVDAVLRQVRVHQARGELGRALDELAVAMQNWPAQWELMAELAAVEFVSGSYRSAHKLAMEAAEVCPDSPKALAQLARRFRELHECAALDRCVDRLPALSRIPIPDLLVIGAQLSYLNRQERALALLDEAKRGDPDYPPTLLARAQVLTYLGRFDDAQADLERCLKLAPRIARLYWQLAMLGRVPRSMHLAERIEAELQRRDISADDTAWLAFALHAELDRQQQYDGAWRALARACQAKRSCLVYRPDDTDALIAGLIAHRADEASSEGAAATRVPIFIVGMHRSGTTLLEQLLDGHSQVKGVGELYDFTGAMRYATNHRCRGVVDSTLAERATGMDFGGIGADYLRRLECRLGPERYFTDKLPSNFLNVGFICQALPQAKILHMVRDPIETCFSNLRELFSDANPYSYDQQELADFHNQYRRIMAHWHARFPGRILDVDYRALTLDPERMLRQVSAFCGFEFEPAMLETGHRMRSVATASAVQVRQAVQAREVPKWKPYEQYLQPLIRGLQNPVDRGSAVESVVSQLRHHDAG